MSPGEGRATGRVLRTSGGAYDIDVDGETLSCSLRGKLKKERAIGRVAVGDEVGLDRLPDGSGVIDEVHERRSVISRRAAHGRREQIIAANIDQLAAVFSIRRPEPMLTLLDRFLVLAESTGIAAFIVVNKIDLSSEAEARKLFELYQRIGYDVLYTSTATGVNVDALAGRLSAATTLLGGPSGVGKSTLLNTIQPGLGLAVGEVSEALEKGVHTTVEASMHALAGGGYVVDSPGLRRLRLAELGDVPLDWCFKELRELIGSCRFPDCRHIHEPGCSVQAALQDGSISDERFTSYSRILQEYEE